jgi:hypothetical protein
MMIGPIEIYQPRRKSARGIWTLGHVQFKVYDLLAEGKVITEEVTRTAERFLSEEVMSDVEKMGDSNGLGFVIIHLGDRGLTIAAHWWAQGSVLCQRTYRRQYESETPMDTVNRPAVACVWELEIINSEREIWRETMMTPNPHKTSYLETLAT